MSISHGAVALQYFRIYKEVSHAEDVDMRAAVQKVFKISVLLRLTMFEDVLKKSATMIIV